MSSYSAFLNTATSAKNNNMTMNDSNSAYNEKSSRFSDLATSFRRLAIDLNPKVSLNGRVEIRTIKYT